MSTRSSVIRFSPGRAVDRSSVAKKPPVLGICLGAQLLAKTLGARVYPNRVKEIGWYPVELTPAAADDPLFAQSGTRTLFQWHGDTFDLPPELSIWPVARHARTRLSAMGSSAYGLQFHIEMTAGMIADG